MNIEKLRKLVQKIESQNVEFKTSTSQLKAGMETACAFLNTNGGTILFGVKNNGDIIGQHVTDNTQQEIAKELKKIEPHAQIETYYVSIGNGLKVIALEVPIGKHTPYAYDGRPFVRNQSSTDRMTQHRYEQLIIQRKHLNHSWEEILTEEFTLEDLDHDEIRRTIEDGIKKNRISPEGSRYSIEQILKNFNLIKDSKLTNAAVALFAKNPEQIFPRCEIKMARFRGKDRLQGNELIANVFYKRGWIEKWGTGTTRMMDYCDKNRSPEPEFFADSNGFAVIFPFKESMNSGVNINLTPTTEALSLTARQVEILNLLNNTETMSANTILEKLSAPPAPRTLRDDLIYLKNNGLIDSKGHAKTTKWFKVKTG